MTQCFTEVHSGLFTSCRYFIGEVRSGRWGHQTSWNEPLCQLVLGLNWAIFSVRSTVIAVFQQDASYIECMMYADHTVPICGASMHLRLDQLFTSGAQNRWSGRRSWLNWAIISVRSTVITQQQHCASIMGLAMIYADHTVPMCGASMHLCLDQWFTSGAQRRCSSRPSRLSWATIPATHRSYRNRNKL